MRFLFLSLLASPILGLTITYPTASSTIDPSQAFTITWTSTASDPDTLSFVVHETDSAVLATDETLASGVKTSLGSFTVAANSIGEFGTGFVLQALNGGDVIAQSGTFTLAAGEANVQTLSNGQETFVSVTTEASSTTAATVATTTGAAASTTSGAGTTGVSFSSAGTGSVSVTSKTTATNTNSKTTTGSTITDSSPSSTTAGAAATSTALAGNLRVGVAGLVGGLFGAAALLI